MSHKKSRKQLFVDRKVQGALIGRAVFYWAFCILSITLMLLCWRVSTGPARMFYTHFTDMRVAFGPALVASFLLLPLVILDLVRLSNRFVGPMVRLRHSMRALARGEHVEPIHFRDGDFWQEFADEFNQVAQKIQDQPPATEPASPPSREEDAWEEPVLAGTDHSDGG